MEEKQYHNGSEFIMFYNLENLFSPDPKPINKMLPSPSGLKSWNSWRYNNKIYKIAHVFDIVKEEKGILPALIGVSEVQGRKPLEDLLKLSPFNSTYDVVHYESMDERGVDVALLYDKNKIEILHSEPISFIFEIPDNDPENYDTTRDVLYCKLKFYEETIHLFVCHLPSKRDNDVNKPKRAYITKEINQRISKIIKEEHQAVIVCGDFNENPNDENIIKLVYDDKNNKILINTFVEIYNNKNYSTFHYGEGLLFDQIILSDDFFKEDFTFKFKSSQVFKNEQISSWDKKFSGRPFRTYAGTRYLGGYSDHFPVLLELIKTETIKN